MKLIIISLLLWIWSWTKLNNLFKALNNMNEFLIFEEVVSRYKRPEFEGLHINATYDEVLKYFKYVIFISLLIYCSLILFTVNISKCKLVSLKLKFV